MSAITSDPSSPRLRRPRAFAAGWTSALALAALAGLAGCDFLSTATPEQPLKELSARPIPLTCCPDSVLANMKEAFRVGDVTAYMQSIYQPIQQGADVFTVQFAPEDQQEIRASAPSDTAIARLLSGGWHVDQERSAIGSVLNPYSSVPDTGRFQYTIVNTAGGTQQQPRYIVNYKVNIPSGTAPYIAGTAALTFIQDLSGNWKILGWEDARLLPPPVKTLGRLRFDNRS